MSEKVCITEVGLRDGLQNQPETVSTKKKLELANSLIGAGIRVLEAASFVHPKIVPQMADAVDVVRGLPKQEGLTITALVPNLKGYQRARECGITHIGIVIASTDTFNKRNINMTLAEAAEECQQIILQAKKDEVHVRTYISGACACPYDGQTRVDVTQGLSETMLLAGSDEVSIADTTGAGNPQQILDILGPLVQQFGADRFNLHLHDTRGQALAMAWAGITEGVRKFDSSIGGLGGCPFAPGASGNLATEDLVYLLHESGFETGINLQALRQAVSIAESITGQQLGGRILQWMRSQENRITTKPCITP